MENLGDRIDVYFYNEKIAGALHKDFVLVQPKLLEVAYGIPIRSSTTLIALDVTASPISIRIPDIVEGGSLPHLALFLQQSNQEHVGRLETFGDDHRIVVPIAIFIDVDSVKEK